MATHVDLSLVATEHRYETHEAEIRRKGFLVKTHGSRYHAVTLRQRYGEARPAVQD